MSGSAHLLERVVHTLQMPQETLAWSDTGIVLTSDNALKYICEDLIEWDAGKWAYPEGTYLYPSSPQVPYYALRLCLQSNPGIEGLLAEVTTETTHVVPLSLVLCFVSDGDTPPIGVDYGIRGFRSGRFNGQTIASRAVGPPPWRVWVGFNYNSYAALGGKFTITLEKFGPGGTFDMATRYADLQKGLIGVQSVVDTPVTPSILLQCVKLGGPSPDQQTTTHKPEGSKRVSKTILEKESTRGNFSGKLDATEALYIIQSVLAKPISDDADTPVMLHIVDSDSLEPDDMAMYTAVYGESNGHERCFDLRFDSFSIASDGNTLNFSGTYIAKAMQDSINDALTFPTGAAEVQTLTETGTPVSGGYDVEFNGAPFTIPFDCSSSDLQTLLDGLSTVGASNSVVSGGPFPGSALVVTFAAALAGRNLPLIRKVDNNLGGGVAPELTIVETTRGGFTQFAQEPFARHEATVQIADTLVGLETADVLGNFQHSLNIGGKTGWYWTENGLISPTDIAEGGDLSETLQLVLKAGTELADLRAANLDKSKRYVRLTYRSKSYKVPATSTYKEIVIDMACEVESIADYGGKGENSRVYGAVANLRLVKDETWGDKAIQVRAKNAKTAYTS